jgi:transposase
MFRILQELNGDCTYLEGFWSYAKERFMKYHGINNRNYPLYLKEMEFRYNHRNEDVFIMLVDIENFE